MTVSWERIVPMLIKIQLGLFHLFPYMLRKFNWESSSLDDFKAKLANYRACPWGWDEWVNIVSIASFELWTHIDQVSQSLVYGIKGLGFIGFCHVIYHLIGLFCNMLLWFDSSVNRYLYLETSFKIQSLNFIPFIFMCSTFNHVTCCNMLPWLYFVINSL